MTALAQAAAAYHHAQAELDRAREELRTAALRELAGGMPQATVARITGWTREHLRQLERRAARPEQTRRF